MAITIDLRVPPCKPASEVAAFVRQCEEAGFDGVGILDSQMYERDVFVTMALAAQATSRIRVVSAVTNPMTRHPSVLASAAKTVSELTPGRVEIWVGRGYTAVQSIGEKPATVRQMRESVLSLKSLMAGEEMSFNGTTSRLLFGDADVPPVYISANGPRTMEVAGEVADGAVLMIGLHPGAIKLARHHLDEGARRAGRDPAEVKLILTATTIVHEDQREAREMGRPLCIARLMDKSHARWLEASELKLENLELPKELWDIFPDISHAEDQEQARRVCSFLPDDMLAQLCDTIGLIGTPEYCVQRLKEAEASGIDHLYLMTSNTFAFPHNELRAFKETIFPMLAAAA